MPEAGNVCIGQTVTITHGDDTHTLTTEAERLSSLLRRSGIRLGEDEMVELNVAGEAPPSASAIR